MLHAEHSVVIRRRPAEVFDYLADGTNNAEWRAGVVEIVKTSATSERGATYRQVLSGPGGRKIDGDYVVTDFDRPWHLAFEVTAGPARPKGRYDLVEDSGATLIRMALELQPTGLMRFATGMIAKQLRAEVDQLGRLKAILESTPQ